MAVCDMCGKESNLLRTEIEGSILNVCSSCAKFGKVLSQSTPQKPILRLKKKQPKQEKEPTEIIVHDYATLIKKKRESMSISQEDFAKKINEKLSLIHKIETGSIKPNISLARKVERFLNIKIIDEYKEENSGEEKPSSEVMTIGDLLKLSKK